MALRMVLEVLPDIGVSENISLFKKDSDSWPLLLAIISTVNILFCGSVYLSFYLVKMSEDEIANAGETMTLVNEK